MIFQKKPWFRYIVTDNNFGPVIAGDETFLERFKKPFGFEPKRLAWMGQVHSSTIRIVEKLSAHSVIFPETDGLMTREKGVLLITKTADCVPILLWNEQEKIIVALHCGWKGFFRGILESFQKACQTEGVTIGNFSAFLGPHLRVEHFEVAQDFIDQIPNDKKQFLIEHKHQPHYNLTQGVITTLQSFGVRDLHDSGISTYNSADYFSYRKWFKEPEETGTPTYSTFASAIMTM